jgi:hypothetical protein
LSSSKTFSNPQLWWQWLIATAATFGIGLLLTLPQFQIGAGIGTAFAFLPTGSLPGFVSMALAGLFQAFVLQPHLPTWRWWIPTTVLAWLAWLALSAYTSLPGMTSPGAFFGPFLSGTAWQGLQLGALIGLFQWPLLRTKVRDASWWIPITTITYVLALPSVARIGLLNAIIYATTPTTNNAQPIIISGVYCGTVIGAISGLGLLWLFRSQTTTPNPPTL